MFVSSILRTYGAFISQMTRTVECWTLLVIQMQAMYRSGEGRGHPYLGLRIGVTTRNGRGQEDRT